MDMLPPLVARRAVGRGTLWAHLVNSFGAAATPGDAGVCQDEEEIAFNFFRQSRKCDD